MQRPITLIATLGSSPAILTETIWGIYDEGWGTVRNIEIITTDHGRNTLLNKLIAGNKPNVFEQVCDYFNIEKDTMNAEILKEHIHVPKIGNVDLEDIKNIEDDRAIAELIKNIVQERSAEPYPIIASLAGGRKTMAARLSTAMELFGTPSDKLVHVLVNAPYEHHKVDFYFPEQEKQELEHPDDNDTIIHAKDAVINLVDIPFLHLGKAIRDSVDTDKSLDELVRITQARVYERDTKAIDRLVLNVEEREVTINEAKYTEKLSAKLFSLILFLAWINKKHHNIVGVSLIDIVENRWHELFHTIWENTSKQPISDDLYHNVNYIIGRKKYSNDDYSEVWQEIQLKNDRLKLVNKIKELWPNINPEDLFSYHRLEGAKSEHTLHVLPHDIKIIDNIGLLEKLVG